MKILKKLLAIIIPTIAATQAAFAVTPALFYASSFDVNVGETVSFDLKINPSSPVYTVGATLKYDPSVLSFSDASIDKSWLPLSRAPYEVTDTASGEITRTAGYPEGLSGTTPFTHYVFRAIAPGDTKVTIPKGMSLDQDNNDMGLQSKVITIHVHGKEATPKTTDESPAPTPAKKLAPQTVTLEISGANATYSDQDYSFTVLHKLKVGQDTVGSTTFSVFNQNGEEVYTAGQDLSTATDTTLTFTIPANSVAAGDYSLIVNSKYSNQKTPTTERKDIGVLARADHVVEKNVPVPMIPWWAYAIGGFLLFIIIIMTIYNKSKAFRKFVKNF